MSMFGYRKELDKYEEVDEDELLASLTAEELEELEKELADIDPDANVPIGLRQRDQTAKTPTGTFSREALLKYWENETRKLLEEERSGSSPKQGSETQEDPDKEVESVTESNSEVSEEEDSDDEEEDDDDEDEEQEYEEESEEEASTEDEDEDEDEPEEEPKRENLKSPSPVNTHNICTGLSKFSSRGDVVKSGLPTTNGDADIKVTSSRPCGNPTVIDETLEKIQNNDPDLTEVNLNNIENVSQETLVSFANALKSNTQVLVFSLANTRADDQVAFAIGKMLRENSSVTSLNIESNFITGKGILAIMQALTRNCTLTELRFHNQRHICGGQVEMEIAKLLRENTTLLKLGYQFDLPGPRMSMTSILTRNQDRQRQKRMQEQRLAGGPDGPVNPRTSALQRGTPTSSPYGSPRGSPWSSPKLPRPNQAQKNTPPAPPPPPPPPPRPPPPPPLPPSHPVQEKKPPTRNIAEVIRQQERRKRLASQPKVKTRKGKKGAKKEKETSILKELKKALRPISDKRIEDVSRPSTPQRSVHDELMASIRGSSIRQLRRVEVPQSLR